MLRRVGTTHHGLPVSMERDWHRPNSEVNGGNQQDMIGLRLGRGHGGEKFFAPTAVLSRRPAPNPR